MLSAIAPNVIMPSVIMLNAILPSVIMLNAIMMSVIMSNVAAPFGVANFIFAFKALSWGHLFPGFEGESFFFLSLGLSFSFIFHQYFSESHSIQYYLGVIFCPLVVLPYPHRLPFPRLWNSPISKSRITHSTREHRRRESIVRMHFCFVLENFLNFFIF
jgi:hypothetical protein